jgi:hypothetical protein
MKPDSLSKTHQVTCSNVSSRLQQVLHHCQVTIVCSTNQGSLTHLCCSSSSSSSASGKVEKERVMPARRQAVVALECCSRTSIHVRIRM